MKRKIKIELIAFIYIDKMESVYIIIKYLFKLIIKLNNII